MSNFFVNFPKVSYKGTTAVDLTRRFKVIDTIRNNPYVMLPYTIKDVETPEDVAYKYYGDERLSWIVLIANTIIDPSTQWPMNIYQLEKHIATKYVDRYKDWLYESSPETFAPIRSNMEQIFLVYSQDNNISNEDIYNSVQGDITEKYIPYIDFLRENDESDLNSDGQVTQPDYTALTQQEAFTGKFKEFLFSLYDPSTLETDVLSYTKNQNIRHNIVYYEGSYEGENNPIVFNDATFQENEYVEEGGLEFGYTKPLDASWEIFRIWEYENIQNENNRVISLIDKKYISSVLDNVRSLYK